MVKSLMVQGTASDAGKSIIAGGVYCRIFKQDGLEVVPFKSQNMALNSFITKKEMKWAGLRSFRLRQLARSQMSA